MKKTELRNELFSTLAVLLKPYEFSLVRRMDWFVRKGPSTLIYRLDFYGGYDRDSGYRIAPSLAVRIKEVEDLYHLASGFEPKYQKDTPTIWFPVKDLIKSKDDLEFELSSAEDIEPVANELFDIFKDIGLPFLEKNNSIDQIDKLLNSKPENRNSIFDTPTNQFCRGIILAKLVKRENYREIVETYRSYLPKDVPDYLQNYDKLVGILEDF